MSAQPDLSSNIPATFFKAADLYPDEILYSQAIFDSKDPSSAKPRRWYSRTRAEVRERVKQIAHYLKSVGVVKGSRAAIFSATRPEWMEADLAILSLGAVTVSIYHNLPEDIVGYILYDSGADFVFAENQEQVDCLLSTIAKPCNMPATEEREASTVRLGMHKIISFEAVSPDALVISLAEILAGGKTAELTGLDAIGWDDLAALVYTSGTTGAPKGVMQSHGNHLSNVRQVWHAKIFSAHDSLMLFLPLAHSFAKLMGYLGFLTPISLKFPAVPSTKSSKYQPSSVMKDLREANAVLVPVVPRVFEKMQDGLLAKAKQRNIGALLLRLALWSAGELSRTRRDGTNMSLLALMGYEGTAPIRRKIKEGLLGRAFACAISGGAKLNVEVCGFFDALDIEILEGYGLTETCVATNVNRPGQKKIGTVGPVLDGDIEVKIAADGEVLFRGPNVAKGYYRREVATRAAWDGEGWFHTGDLGSMDGEGRLSIVGRKKSFILTSYGKHVSADRVEQKLMASEYISQAVLVGEGRSYCVALVTLDKGAIKVWSRRRGIEIERGMYGDQRVYDLVWKDVEAANQELASFEAVKKIAILPLDFSMENGFLTPTFKVKKSVVLEKFAQEIENLYK